MSHARLAAAAARCAVALLALGLVAGCSAIRIAYDNADTFVRWRITSYLDLSGDAMDELDERIAAFHAWHRAEALPQYARLAEEAARRLEDGASPADISWGHDAVLAQGRESLREGAERIAPLLDKLTPEQIRHIEQRFAEDNRKFAKENIRVSERERRRLRFQRTRDRLEEFVGSLSEAQTERVRQFANRTPLFDDLRDRDHKRLQAQILEVVRAREAQKKLAATLLAWRDGREPAYVAAQDALRAEWTAMIADVDRTLTAQQRARAAARLRGYAEDFTALAAGARARAPARGQ